MIAPLEFYKLEDVLVVRLAGDLTTFLLDRVKNELVTEVRKGRTYRVLIDLDGVDYITSKDIGLFVQVYHFLENEGKEKGAKPVLAFSSLKPFVKDVMQATRLVTVFKIYPTEEEALNDLVPEESGADSAEE